MLDKAKLTRRSFAKLSASMAVAGLVGGAVRGEALAAVEEPESREKVERIRTCCRGCGKMECGVWVTVRDGRAVAIEGDESIVPIDGELLLEIEGVAAGGVSP